MKKIPTLFEKVYENHRVIGITDKVTKGMEWVLEGEGIATVKIDGACCAIINGELYRRYDAKKWRTPPEGAIPCCEADPITGHWPHWVKCDINNPADKWFVKALKNTKTICSIPDGTYEAFGPHFQGNPYDIQGNPYNVHRDSLYKHGKDIIEVERTFEGIKKYLSEHEIEGIVFWKDGEPQCKIKRSDFGFKWPIRKEE